MKIEHDITRRARRLSCIAQLLFFLGKWRIVALQGADDLVQKVALRCVALQELIYCNMFHAPYSARHWAKLLAVTTLSEFCEAISIASSNFLIPKGNSTE